MQVSQESLPFATLLRNFSDLRSFSLKFVANVGAEAAMTVPDGFKNSLHWQVGHLLYTQDIALFGWCGLPSRLGRYFPEYFGRGTSPGDYDSLAPDWDDLLSIADRESRALPEVLDRMGGALVKPVRLMDIGMGKAGETLPFLMAHEGEHIAHIKRLRAAVLRR